MATVLLSMKTTCLAFMLLFAVVIMPAKVDAQDLPLVQIFGGLTFLDTSDMVERPTTGWLAGGVWNLTEKFGLEIHISRLEHSESITFLAIDSQFLTLLAGPTKTWRLGPVQSFGHLLLGTTQLDISAVSDIPFPLSGTSQDTNGTLLIGGGFEIPLAQHLSTRFGYDYRWIFAVKSYYQHGIYLSALYGF
jgi:hypothetical protein